MASRQRPSGRKDFHVALVCALPREADAVTLLFDQFWDEESDPYGRADGDTNTYITGRMGKHDVVLAVLPGMGTSSAAAATASLRSSFTNMKLAFLVGCCGGVPCVAGRDLFLGDVVISKTIVQYDYGRQYPGHFAIKTTVDDSLGRAPQEIRSLLATFETELMKKRLQTRALEYLKSLQNRAVSEHRRADYRFPGIENDHLYPPAYNHLHRTPCQFCRTGSIELCESATKALCAQVGCSETELVAREPRSLNVDYSPEVFIGRIGSGNAVMKSGSDRDRIAKANDIIAFEMEGAGAWDQIPCIVVKGICDYADSHKNKRWQDFASATAASMSKSILDRCIINDEASNHGQNNRQEAYRRNVLNNSLDPTIIIPFTRDKDFVRREHIFEKVQKLCSEPGSWVALVGLGGIGKSQIAIEYAYYVRDRSPNTWVFWVHASNAARYEQSFRDLADQVKIPGRQDPQNNIFQVICSWLRSAESGNWLVVLDNVDDASFLLHNSRDQIGQTSAHLAPLISYLPRCTKGSVLITSRYIQVARRLVESRDIVDVGPMSQEDALTLMEVKFGTAEYHQHLDVARKLASELEFIPLAIVQATSYITQRAPLVSLQQYLEKVQHSDQKRANLLEKDGGHLRRDREAKNSIILTWQISFDHIRDIRPSAADLLSLMSFCDRQGIPRSLLQSLHDDADSISDVSDLLDEDLITLRDYSFISINKDGMAFEMHALIQLSMQRWLKDNRREEQWKQEFTHRLSLELPTGEYRNWAKCQAFLPHAKAAFKQRPKTEDAQDKWAAILYNAAWYLKEIGEWDEAEKFADNAMKTTIELFGKDGKKTSSAMAMTASVYRLKGRWDEAEEMQGKVLEICKATHGPNHPSTILSMTSLASTYKDQGQWDEAEKLLFNALEICKATLRPDHVLSLTSMNNLGSVYMDQGRWDEAEKLRVKVLSICKSKLGPDHLYTLRSITNLGLTYRSQGRLDEAEKLQTDVLESCKVTLGSHHQDTLASMNNLALTYRDQGQWDQAEKLGVEVLRTCEAKFGPGHPNTLRSIANLASTCRDQGRWDEAERFGVEALEKRKAILASGHPDILHSMADLALTYRDQSRWREAEKLGVEVLETRKAKLGPNHPATLRSMNNLASTLFQLGHHAKAVSLMKICCTSQVRILGEQHPHTRSSANTLSEWESILDLSELNIA